MLQGALIALAGEAGAGENIANIVVEKVRCDPFEMQLFGLNVITIVRYQGLADFAANMRPARNMR